MKDTTHSLMRDICQNIDDTAYSMILDIYIYVKTLTTPPIQ